MNKIEMIRVYTALDIESDAVKEVENYLKSLRTVFHGSRVQIMTDWMYPYDIAVFIENENAEELWKSPGGLLIAEKLNQLGQVSHSVWLEYPERRPRQCENLRRQA